MDKDGIIVHAGKLVDATIVEVPVQRNSRDENKDIKQGNIPEEWKDNKHRLRQKDIDAQWVTHNGTDYFGYKDYIKADEKTLLITGYEVTASNVHGSVMLEDLMSKKEDGGQPLHFKNPVNRDLLKKDKVQKANMIKKLWDNRPLIVSNFFVLLMLLLVLKRKILFNRINIKITLIVLDQKQ